MKYTDENGVELPEADDAAGGGMADEVWFELQNEAEKIARQYISEIAWDVLNPHARRIASEPIFDALVSAYERGSTEEG